MSRTPDQHGPLVDLGHERPQLPARARKVLDEKLDNRKAIKQLVKNWKPDYLRA